MEIIDLSWKRYWADTIFKVKVEWPLRNWSKVIICDTPSHASDHLYQIWKESIKNCICNRADTIFKAKAKWPWRYSQGPRALNATQPVILAIICAKFKKESTKNCKKIFKVKAENFFKIVKNLNFHILKKAQHETDPLVITIICAKYTENPSRTVDATERKRSSNSRPNDLEDIGQGQGSSHATHPLLLLIICIKYENNPSWTVDATGRTRKVNGQSERRTDGRTDGRRDGGTDGRREGRTDGRTDRRTDGRTGQTDRQTDRQTGWIQYTPLTSLWGYNNHIAILLKLDSHFI